MSKYQILGAEGAHTSTPLTTDGDDDVGTHVDDGGVHDDGDGPHDVGAHDSGHGGSSHGGGHGGKSSSCWETIKPMFFFETIKLVTIHSVKFGALHRSMQLLVVIYIVVYSIYLKAGYQEYSAGAGMMFLKAKGTGFVNSSGDVSIYDSTDFVQPSVENEALFVVTNFFHTYQTRGICNSITSCKSNADCPNNKLTEYGIIVPTCNITTNPKTNKTSGLCLIQGWCPLEDDKSITSNIQGLGESTIFMRTAYLYTLFSITVADSANPIPNQNLFYLKDMLAGGTLDDCVGGCMIRVQIDWTCNLNLGTSACTPTVQFSKPPGTYNYRKVTYDSDDDSSRDLEKLFGIRFIFSVTGKGGRFSFFQLVITFGSSAAFLTIATLVTDYVLFFLFRSEKKFIGEKFSEFKTEEEEEGVVKV